MEIWVSFALIHEEDNTYIKLVNGIGANADEASDCPHLFGDDGVTYWETPLHNALNDDELRGQLGVRA